jgi:LysM repeat protein
LAYPTLVSQGHLNLKQQSVKHTVEKGDTLLQLAARYRVTTDQLRELNQLESSVIRVGQQLTIQKPVHLRGAFEPVRVPARRLPPTRAEESPSEKTAKRE